MSYNIGLSDFTQPSIETYIKLFADSSANISIRGGGFDNVLIFKPRGAGFFGFLKRALLPIVKPTLMQLGKNLLKDIGDGKNVKDSIKQRGIESIREIGRRTISRGAGRKRKKGKKTKNHRHNKRIKRDIFTD